MHGTVGVSGVLFFDLDTPDYQKPIPQFKWPVRVHIFNLKHHHNVEQMQACCCGGSNDATSFNQKAQQAYKIEKKKRSCQ